MTRETAAAQHTATEQQLGLRKDEDDYEDEDEDYGDEERL